MSSTEDLLQPSLLRTQRHADRIAAMGAPAAYLRRALVHEHLSGVRRLARRLRTAPLEGHDVASDGSSSPEERDAIWRAGPDVAVAGARRARVACDPPLASAPGSSTEQTTCSAARC